MTNVIEFRPRSRWRRTLIRFIDRFLAYYHLDDATVCRLSEGLPPDGDYHDYQDSTLGTPAHLTTLTCKRCRKRFVI